MRTPRRSSGEALRKMRVSALWSVVCRSSSETGSPNAYGFVPSIRSPPRPGVTFSWPSRKMSAETATLSPTVRLTAYRPLSRTGAGFAILFGAAGYLARALADYITTAYAADVVPDYWKIEGVPDAEAIRPIDDAIAVLPLAVLRAAKALASSKPSA